MGDTNISRYNDPTVVGYYEKQSDVFECERVLFERFVMPESKVLDIGVGGGRTTAWLAGRAAKYVGVDYSKAMVEACQRKFPGIEFFVADATDMHTINDGAYDVVVFSFNGIDMIGDEARTKCLSEVNRILEKGGIFIFSSHNARQLAVWPELHTAHGHQIPWRIIRAFFKSFAVAKRTLGSGVFAAAQGYIHDPVHGGLHTYTSTPLTMVPQLRDAGFEVMEIVGGHYPVVNSLYFTNWHYYACQKAKAPL